jgi:hypothetical protein
MLASVILIPSKLTFTRRLLPLSMSWQGAYLYKIANVARKELITLVHNSAFKKCSFSVKQMTWLFKHVTKALDDKKAANLVL